MAMKTMTAISVIFGRGNLCEHDKIMMVFGHSSPGNTLAFRSEQACNLECGILIIVNLYSIHTPSMEVRFTLRTRKG